MSFKKYKIKKNSESIIDTTLESFKEKYHHAKRRNYFSGILLWIIGVTLISFLWVFTFAKISNFSIDLSFLKNLSIGTLSNIDPDQEKINILLTWVWWWDHDGTDLTDTIILASINTKNKTISMLSLPRDLYVNYPSGWAGRINELYRKWKESFSESKAMSYLEDKIEEITWEKTDYFLNIDFAWFTKFVDLLDGIEVDVPFDLIDKDYPDNNWWYETFKIKKWKQVLDWTTALKYARSRHSTSDFDRSLRQQLVIKAIKTKLFNLNYIGNPIKLKALFYAVNSNMKTNMWIKEILYMASLAKDIPNSNIFSFNLNNSCEWWVDTCETWWFLYSPDRGPFWWAAVILPEGATANKISRYIETSKFANIVINTPEILLEKHEINFINATKVSWLAGKFANMFKKYWFNIPDKDSIFSTKDLQEKSKIYYIWNENTKLWVNPGSKTLEAISQFLISEQLPILHPKYSTSPWVKIEIVIWSDYKLFLNN